MNRDHLPAVRATKRVPHRRGDEPDTPGVEMKNGPVFPTGVGMNRWRPLIHLARACVPHRRGDEPAIQEITALVNLCSPQAWG